MLGNNIPFFPTFDSLSNNPLLTTNTLVLTLGHDRINDGRAKFYYITDEIIAIENSIMIQLQNGLYALEMDIFNSNKLDKINDRVNGLSSLLDTFIENTTRG